MTEQKHEGVIEGAATLNKMEQWFEHNKKMITYVVGAFVVVVGGYFAVTQFYLKPKEASAQNDMFMAQKYFEQDSLKLALNGDGNYPVFLKIIDDYKWTASANLAHYYAGCCYLQTGKFDEAISMFQDYKAKDHVTGAMALGCLGDAYSEKGDMTKAIEYYKQAAASNENGFTTPMFLMRAGMALEHEGKGAEAKSMYEQIQFKYPNSQQARDIEKYIARASN